MSAVHRSIFFSAAERYGGFVLSVISTAVMARLLTPQEFGIFAVIGAIVAVITAFFQEFGGANYLIQKGSLSAHNIRTAFTITFCLSSMIGMMLVVTASEFAKLFQQEALKEGITVIALNFALTPFSVTISALFRRDMEFGKLAVCNLVANFVVVAVSIALAVLQYSYLAPIWGLVAGNIALSILLIISWGDLTIFRPSLSGYRNVMSFGLYSSAVCVINAFYNLAPQLFLARILDFAAVGLYSRAVGATQVFDKLVGQVLGPVIMPAIFAQMKAGGDLKQIYLDSLSLLSAVHWPFLSFIAVMAHPIILIWLGTTWLDVIPLVQMLCVANLFLFAACLTYPVLVAVGSVRDSMISSAISLPPSLLLVFAASFFGVKAVAAISLLTLPFQAAVAIFFIKRHLDLSLSDLFRATWKSGVATLVSITGPMLFAVMIEVGYLGPVVGLVLACLSAAVGWCATLFLTEHPLPSRLQFAAKDLVMPIRYSLARLR
ncbi:O-antigen/teichoic acid export membrane protein [Nitrobacteraceae bacterium AZCC 1564]